MHRVHAENTTPYILLLHWLYTTLVVHNGCRTNVLNLIVHVYMYISYWLCIRITVGGGGRWLWNWARTPKLPCTGNIALLLAKATGTGALVCLCLRLL